MSPPVAPLRSRVRASAELPPPADAALRATADRAIAYCLHEVGPVLAGGVLHPVDRTADVVRFYRDFTAASPDELSLQALTITFPELGRIVGIGGCYCGSIAEGEKVLEPLRRFGSPLADLFGPMEYVLLQSMFDPLFPPGRHVYTKANFLTGLNDDAIRVFAEFATAPSPYSAGAFEHLEGAVSRVGSADTAFAHRQYPYDFSIWSSWTDPADSEKNVTWTRTFWDAMRPFMAAGAYVNYLEDEADPQARHAYGANHDRLAALKQKYDPTNLFRMNHNVRPSLSSPEAAPVRE